MIKKYLVALFLIFGAVTLCGCSLKFWGSEPPKLIVNINADDKINPNIDDEATSVSVQIVQLGSDEMFNKALFIDLYNDANGVLGPDFISSKTLSSVLPNSKEHVEVRLAEKTAFVGAVVGFSQYDNASGKVILPVKDTSSDLELELYINGVKAELKKKD